jgi:hypothetical protein
VPHFYFDIWDGESLAVDDEGLDLNNQRTAELEAVLSLADIAKELETFASIDCLAIEVRNAGGLILRVTFACERVQPLS